jgi:predicted nucleic acid-binding protein
VPTLERMTRFVVDAPTLLHLVDEHVPVHPDHRLVAPNSIRSEAMDLLLRQVREGALDEREALERHERMTEVKLRLLGDRVSRRTAWRIAREHGWDELRDAEYLAVAHLQADALVTVDSALAAKAEGVVRVGVIQDLVDAQA